MALGLLGLETGSLRCLSFEMLRACSAPADWDTVRCPIWLEAFRLTAGCHAIKSFAATGIVKAAAACTVTAASSSSP
jgi:hypothetical protein